MPLEDGIRFLTNHLDGDTYFTTHRLATTSTAAALISNSSNTSKPTKPR